MTKYEKPRIIYSEKIEAKAGSCAGGGAKTDIGAGCTGPFIS